MNVLALALFLAIFLAVTIGTPFVLVTFLPTVHAMLGSIGTSLLSGAVLYILLVYLSKPKS